MADLTQTEMRLCLEHFCGLPEVLLRTDPLQCQLDDAAIACLERDELALGMSIMALGTLRAMGLHTIAARLLIELAGARPRVEVGSN